MSKRSLMHVAPLFLVLFIDSMGLGLLFPILNSVIIDPTVSFLSSGTSLFTRDFLYGLVIGVFMLSWFFGAAILGDLSDFSGRKRALMICLVGAFFGYLLSAIAILYRNISMLIISRIIAGFTAGSQPIAQAAIVDVSSDENKARNIGYILLAISLGFVCGPILGGVLSDSELVHWFTFSTPLYFSAGISLLNAALLWFFFHETHRPTEKFKLKLHRAIHVIISAFTNKKVRSLSIVLFIMIAGWSNFFTFISMYVLHKFNFDPLKVSMFLAVMGLGFSLGCGLLVEYFDRYFSLKATACVSFLVCSGSIFTLVIIGNELLSWFLVLTAGAGMAVGYSDIITLFSNQVSAEEQGWVMGVTGSIMALCFGLTSLLTGLFADLSMNLPLYIAAIGVALSAAILFIIKIDNDI